MFSDPSRLWKLLENGTLQNKKQNKWQPDGNWTFVTATENKALIRIKNNVNNKILSGFSKAKPNATFVKNRHIQLWKRGQPDNEGYYTLHNSESQKVITAESSTADTDSFELKGKCILFTVFRCLLKYL